MNHKDTHDLNNGMVTWPKDADTSPKDQKTPVFEPTYTHVTYPLGDVQVTDEARECLKRSLEQAPKHNDKLLAPNQWFIKTPVTTGQMITSDMVEPKEVPEVVEIYGTPVKVSQSEFYGLAELKPEGGPNELLMDYIKRNPAKPSESMPSTIKGDE